PRRNELVGIGQVPRQLSCAVDVARHHHGHKHNPVLPAAISRPCYRRRNKAPASMAAVARRPGEMCSLKIDWRQEVRRVCAGVHRDGDWASSATIMLLCSRETKTGGGGSVGNVKRTCALT